MNKDYGEIENQLLLYKSKAQILQMYIELLTKVDKILEIIYEELYNKEDDCHYRICELGIIEVTDKMLEILRGKDDR